MPSGTSANTYSERTLGEKEQERDAEQGKQMYE